MFWSPSQLAYYQVRTQRFYFFGTRDWSVVADPALSLVQSINQALSLFYRSAILYWPSSNRRGETKPLLLPPSWCHCQFSLAGSWDTPTKPSWLQWIKWYLFAGSDNLWNGQWSGPVQWHGANIDDGGEASWCHTHPSQPSSILSLSSTCCCMLFPRPAAQVSSRMWNS